MSDEIGNPAPARRRRRMGRLPARLLLGLGPLAIAAAGVYLYASGGRYIDTENAYVKSDKIAISADVSGRVDLVVVTENENVGAGRVLFRLDDERFRIALAHKEALVDGARREIEALRARHRQKLAELEMAKGDVDYYRRELERSEDLAEKGHVPRSRLDKTRRDMLMARQRVEAIHQDIAGVLASLGGDPAIPVRQHPRVMQAMAERDRAALDLRHATVLAPRSGVVSNLELQVGEWVSAGQPVFSMVVADAAWVEANLKETDLTHVRNGQRARVRIDAYPGQLWQATVIGISPATGAEFAILPPQNSSGNWVKVVQRVPVRLALDPRPEAPPLRAGMSASVEIDTERRRPLPRAIAGALAWVTGER